MKPVAKLFLEDEPLSQQMGPVVDRFNEITDVPILQGRLLEDVSVKEGNITRVKHGLGRKLRGWIVVRRNTTVGIFSDQQVDNKKEDEELWLILTTGTATATYMVSLWVF
jgi:hypothetical protein